MCECLGLHKKLQKSHKAQKSLFGTELIINFRIVEDLVGFEL